MDSKRLLADYTIWGAFIAFVTFLIRPFVSIKSAIRDTAITFLVSMVTGLLMEYVDISEAVRYGISGVTGMFAVRLYEIGDKLLEHVSDNPEEFIHNVKDSLNHSNDSDTNGNSKQQ